jgi:hypothetical protein
MKFRASHLRAVERLLTQGETPRGSLSDLTAGLQLGLWSASEDRSRFVATLRMVELLRALPDAREAAASVFACEPKCRKSWLRIIAARLKEMGQRREVEGLSSAVSTLGIASAAALASLPEASLQPTGMGDFEIALFGAAAEHAVTTPVLLRAIGATADLIEGESGMPAATLPDATADDPRINWVRGRLLRLPDSEKPPESSTILSGSLGPLKESGEPHGVMRWVLARPWPFLLAQVVFMQEAWEAERIAGGMSLELEPNQLARFHCPSQVRVVVTTAAGDEVDCGSLGELIQRVLGQLGIGLLASHLSAGAGALDDLLAPVIETLLQHQVWAFWDAGRGGRRPGYAIHEGFSNECYRAYGSRRFYRFGDAVTAAFRNACVVWAEERLAVSGERATRARVA